MGDEFHRPTLTFPDGAYNASQVRLYGLPGVPGLIFPGKPKGEDTSRKAAAASRSSGDPDDEAKKKTLQLIERLSRELNKSDMEIFRYIIDNNIPIPHPIGVLFQIKIEMRNFGDIVLSTTIKGDEYSKNGKPLSCGIIVGYSYEGHCYDLPKPKIMLIPEFPRELPPDDCGYDLKNDRPATGPDRYMVWIVDKLDECVEFEMNQGFVEQLVLEANMPGKRSPTMYASRMQMAHRSGRLSD